MFRYFSPPLSTCDILLMLLKFSAFRTLVRQANYCVDAGDGGVEAAWACLDEVLNSTIQALDGEDLSKQQSLQTKWVVSVDLVLTMTPSMK